MVSRIQMRSSAFSATPRRGNPKADQMAKEQSERAAALIDRTVESASTQATIHALVEQQRLDIARKQHRGIPLYAKITLTAYFTNDVLDALRIDGVDITDVSENFVNPVVMGHGAIIGSEEKEWWVNVSVPLGPVELSRTEEAAIALEIAEEVGQAPVSLNEEALAEASQERNRLMTALAEAKREEAKGKKEALESPTVIADTKKRAQQQSEIAERLYQLDKQQKAAAPAPAKKAATVPPPAAAPPPPLLSRSAPPPTLVAQDTPLLPGMPGKGPLEKIAQAVAEARAEATRVLAMGKALADRVGTSNSPRNAERQAFFVAEEMWRNAVKFGQNKLTTAKYEQGVAALGELIDRYGPTLKEIRTVLGG